MQEYNPSTNPTENNIETKNLNKNFVFMTHIISGIIHDLNNNLMIINANIDTVTKQMASSPKLSQKLRKARIASEQIRRMIAQLMVPLFIAPEKEQLINPKEYIQTILNLFQTSNLNKQIRIEIDSPVFIPSILVHVGQFQSSIVSFLLNLLSITANEGMISIEIYKSLLPSELSGTDYNSMKDKAVRISFDISGVKQNQLIDNLDTWFKENQTDFFHFLKHTSAEYKFEHLTQDHFKFNFYFPDQEVQQPRRIKATEDYLQERALILQEKNTLLGLEILIVDDDKDIAQALEELIKSFGCHVRSTTSAEEAIREIYRQRPSLVLTDITMKYESGLTLAHHIKKSYPNLPIILVTGNLRMVDKTLDYPLLLKPVSENDLKNAFRKAFEKKL